MDYEKYSKEELIEIIKKTNNKKKIGLTFEKKEENVIKILKNKVPVLKHKYDLDVVSDKSYENNYILEGDNIHALTCLLLKYKGKIDIIYIDPPYNTGNEDFIFNDKFVEKDDVWRHSKWLSFMKPRLRLSRDLLSDNGIIFISIDDNEMCELKLLVDEIFGNNNFIANIIRYIPDGSNISDISTVHEYIITFAKNKNTLKLKPPVIGDENIITRLTKNGNTKSRLTILAGTESVIEEAVFTGTIGGKSEPIRIIGEMKIKNGKLLADVILEAEWAMPNVIKQFNMGKDCFDRQGQKYIKIILNKKGVPYILKKKEVGIFRTVQEYSNEKIDIPNIDFDYPKPVSLIKHLISLHPNKNAIVLDYFAGSGTTGQAVLELNKEDGGDRQFILNTSNENNICSDICYPRLKKVIEGYTTSKEKIIEGCNCNLRYFFIDFINNDELKEQIAKNLKDNLEDFVCFDSEIYEKIIDEKNYKIFNEGEKIVILIFSSRQKYLDEIKNAIEKLTGDIIIYYYSSYGNNIDLELLNIFPDSDIKPIPSNIIECYKEIQDLIK